MLNKSIKQFFDKKRIKDVCRGFFELSIEPMCIVAINDGRFKAVNQAFAQVLGWSEHELIGKPWMSFVHPDDLENSKAAAKRIMKGERYTFLENHYICKDMASKWLSWKAVAVPKEGFVYTIAHDITVQKKDREIKKINEDRLNSLLLLSRMVGAEDHEIIKYSLEAVVRITASKAGYLHFVNEDNNTIELVSWSEDVLKHCSAEKTSHYPIDDAGVWADSVRLRRPVIHNDYQNMPARKGYPEGHFHVSRHMSVPVFDNNKIVAVAGVGNKDEPYDDFDMNQFDLFMYNMWGILKQRKAEEIIERYSREDALTGLANRRRFDQVLDSEWRRAFRDRRPLSVILMDIDLFKRYNDTYGHQVGDECLRKLSVCLGENIRRAGELIARYGGEEFIAVLPGLDIHEAFQMADSMRKCVQNLEIPHSGSPDYGVVTISAGVASMVPGENGDSSELVKMADKALYTAKNEGRNTVRSEE